jgi:hypothetical protein
VSGSRSRLNWISASHHAYHLDHAGSFLSVVVRLAPVVCSSICFFPDRITKWCCEIRRVLRQVLLQLFTGEPTPSPILLLHALLIYCYPYVAILLCHVSYPPVTYMSEIHLLALPIVCCLPALRVVGEFRVFVDISKCSGYLVGMLTHALPFQNDDENFCYN